MAGPDLAFWQRRFETRDLPWDRGRPGPQLSIWIADGTLVADAGPVLVPGCGSGHEVEALARSGFDVTGLDLAPAAVAMARARLDAQGLSANVLEADVLAWRPATPVAAVYEQTCLCALHPDQWTAYSGALHAWLRPGGLLCLMAMQVPRPGAAEGRIEGPPYHLDIGAVRALFPASHWDWPAPPYAAVPHPKGWRELALLLRRR
jgi:hypothetical protein